MGISYDVISEVIRVSNRLKLLTLVNLVRQYLTTINIRQKRRFPSIFREEYEVGNWPLTGSKALVRIQKSGSYYRVRLDLLLLV